jgi:hypothetical protein
VVMEQVREPTFERALVGPMGRRLLIEQYTNAQLS